VGRLPRRKLRMLKRKRMRPIFPPLSEIRMPGMAHSAMFQVQVHRIQTGVEKDQMGKWSW